MNYFHRVSNATATRFWVNNVTRKEAELAIEAGAAGCTQNPAYLAKVIQSQDDGEYIRALLKNILAQTPDDNEAVAELQRRVIAGICHAFEPMYRESHGEKGLVSIQADPFHEDTATILDNAEKSLAMADNFLIKIPATLSGIPAMETLLKKGAAVLATEVMSIDQMIDVCEMHKRCEQEVGRALPLYFAHINGIFDDYLIEACQREGIQLCPDALANASFALAKKMHAVMRERRYSARYMAGGARGLHHFKEMVGVNGAVTINWGGTADKLVALDEPVFDRFSAPTLTGLLDELLEKVPDFRKAYTPGSLTPEAYEHFGPVVKFRDMFEAGWEKAIQIAKESR